MAFQIGDASTVRTLGLNATGLQNTVDPLYGTHALDKFVTLCFCTVYDSLLTNISSTFDVFGISVDIGNISSSAPSISVVWAVGVTRDPSIAYTSLSGQTVYRSSYYRLNFTTAHDIVRRSHLLMV